MSAVRRGARSKTLATWLALVGGSLGLHRFYLHGAKDRRGWLLWLPTLAGAYGVQRMRTLGQDDRLAWVLIPLLGLVIAGTMLNAIVYGLMSEEKWQARYDPSGAGASWPWLNVFGAVVALALGAIALIASIAFVAQRYFEYRAERGPAAPAQSTAAQSVPTQSNNHRLTP